MDGQIEAGHEILLNAQLSHEERMPHILGVHQQMDLPVYRHRHFGGHDVILGILIVRGIEAEEVFRASLICSGWIGPNFPSGPGYRK